MEQYIKKSAIVTEIRKYIKSAEAFLKYHHNRNDKSVYAFEQEKLVMCDLLSFLDTLETKEIDLEKESELIADGIMIDVQANKYNTVVYNTKRNDFNHSHLMLAARKGIELGLKASNPTTAVDQENEWHESSVKPPFTLTMDGNRYSKPMLCYDKFGNYCIAQYARMQTGYCGWYDGYEEVNITNWKELKEVKKGE